MSKEAIEQCTEELYAIHKDLTDVHKDSIKKLSSIAESNTNVLHKMEKLQREIAASVHNIKVYNNRLMLTLFILILLILASGWKFSVYSSGVDKHLQRNQNFYRFMLEGMVEQRKSLERLENLERERLEKSNISNSTHSIRQK